MRNKSSKETTSHLNLHPHWCAAGATCRQRRRFQDTARTIIQLPVPGDAPLEHLLTEAAWNRLVPPNNQEEAVLTALSQATGVYFFPSREWVLALSRFLHLLGIRRVLEAGAGRGYLAAALAPLLARQRIAFQAVDNAQGEFESGLPRHPVVKQADALTAVHDFRAELVVYAWPPRGNPSAPCAAAPGCAMCWL